MSATMAGRRQKIFKKLWLKHPKAVLPKKPNLDQNINDSKYHTRNSFFENISLRWLPVCALQNVLQISF